MNCKCQSHFEKPRFKVSPVLRLVCIGLVLVLNLGLARADNSSPAELLAQAYENRSANPALARAILQKVNKTSLSPALNDRYDYVSAYLLFINGDLQGSIKAFETLALNAHTENEKFVAHASLVNLYAGVQNWSKGFDSLEYVETNIQSIEDRESVEHGHLAAFNFYILIGEAQNTAKYIKPLLNGDYGPRFTCMASVQWLEAMSESNFDQLSESTFLNVIDGCKNLNEPIVKKFLLHRFANYYLELDQADKAFNLLKPDVSYVEDLAYKPLTDGYYDVLSQVYFQRKQYEKAKQFATPILENENTGLISKTKISAYETLYKIAENEGDFENALSLYKKYADAKSLNLNTENAKMLSIQKAKQDSVEKSNRIALLDKENSLLKANAMIDEQSANNRQLLIALMLTLLFFTGIWIYKKRSHYVKLTEMSRKDGLTGIANRRYFTVRATEITDSCSTINKPVSFIVFDLDDFKKINDEHGHKTGDIALQSAVDAAKVVCRSNDIIGRLGGEEFGIMLHGCNLERALHIAESCRQEIERTNLNTERDFFLTASFGVASSESSGYDFDALFEDADCALYKSKENGKNTVESARKLK